jgi:N-acetylmuramoyl-L-alanine amidase-like protein/DDE family transposase
VEHLPQGLGASSVEGGMHSLGARGARGEGVEAPLVEGADGVPDRLRGAPEASGYLRGRLTAGAGQKDLAAAHHEGIFGAQPCFQTFALPFGGFPDKDWRFHAHNYGSLHTTLSEDALERVRSYRDTESYRKALRKRAVWVEPLFGEAKEWHGARRFRLRGLEKVNSEDTGAVNNAYDLTENAENLKVALDLKALLIEDRYNVCMTRTTNEETRSNNERYTYANTTGARVLISIHMNGSSSSSADYTTTLFGKWRKDKAFANTVF